MLGLTSKTSIRLWGSIAENSVMVLVDCGASHNFISDAVVKQQQMSITPTKSYIVEVGDERKIRCEGVCKNVKLHIQGMKSSRENKMVIVGFIFVFFVFELKFQIFV